MTLSISHKKTLSIPDDPAAAAAGQVLPSDWNDGHDLNMATARIVGRATAGDGVAEELTAAQVRTLINVADGADATGATIDAATAKTTPIDADPMPIIDSAASSALKKVTWANIKATLKTYFDSIYAAVVHTHTASQISDVSANGRSLITAADYATMRTLLSLVPGTNVQAYDSDLAAIAGLNLTGQDGKVLGVSGGAFSLLSQGGGWTEIASTTVSTAVSAVDFTAGLSGTYRHLRLVFYGLKLSTANSLVFYQRRQSDNVWGHYMDGMMMTANTSPSATPSAYSGLLNYATTTAAASGCIDMSLASDGFISQGDFRCAGANASYGYLNIASFAANVLTNGLRIANTSGHTITAGTFKLYGMV